MTEGLNQMIQAAAKHWAPQLNTTPDALIEWLRQRKGPISETPEKGWSKSTFSDWGQAQKLTRAQRALKRAIGGNPSPQWLSFWRRRASICVRCTEHDCATPGYGEYVGECDDFKAPN